MMAMQALQDEIDAARDNFKRRCIGVRMTPAGEEAYTHLYAVLTHTLAEIEDVLLREVQP